MELFAGLPRATHPTLPQGTDSAPRPSPLPLLAHTSEVLKEKGGTPNTQLLASFHRHSDGSLPCAEQVPHAGDRPQAVHEGPVVSGPERQQGAWHRVQH